MTHFARRFALALAFLTSLLPLAARAETDNRLRVEVLVDGRPLREYHARGTTYVEARAEREYSLRVTNMDHVRVAVALAVDGRNTIDAKHGPAASARKWILEPWQTITIRGWQVDEETARRFFFTTEDRSYAEWLGDTTNAGVIEAVAFRERPRYQDHGWWSRDEDDRWSRDRSGAREKRADARQAPAGEAQAGAPAPSMRAESSAKSRAQAHDANEDAAATGIGRDVHHDVRRIDFEHESTPSSRVRIRYEYRDELIALGVLPDHRYPSDRRESARGFSDSWCPEPPRRW